MALPLGDLVEACLVETGQFVGGLESTLLTNDQFRNMVKRELKILNKYQSRRMTRGFELYDNLVFQEANTLYVPNHIVKITRNRPHTIFAPQSVYGNLSRYYWRYDKPVLRFSYTRNIYEVTFTLDYTYDDDNDVIEDLDYNDENFVDLVVSRFMQAVGRGRNAFNIPGLNVVHDGAQLASEGSAKYNETLDKLREARDSHIFIGY